MSKNSGGQDLAIGQVVDRIDQFCRRNGTVQAIRPHGGAHPPVLVRWPEFGEEWCDPALLKSVGQKPLAATPEHDKLCARRAEHETIVAFFDWLSSTGRRVQSLASEQPYQTIPLWIDHDPADLIADYFGVDQAELEREKRVMLAAIGDTNV